MTPGVPEDLLEAYRATHVFAELPSGTVRIPAADESPLPALPSELANGAWVLTAWNPGSVVQTREANDALNAELAEAVTAMGCQAWPAWGRARDEDWEEASLIVVGLARGQALLLGARFGQNAIFRLDESGLQVVLVS